MIGHFLVVQPIGPIPMQTALCIETFNATDSLYKNVILCMHGGGSTLYRVSAVVSAPDLADAAADGLHHRYASVTIRGM